MVEKQELLTQEGYNKLEEELEYLKSSKKKRSCRKIKSGYIIWGLIRKC